MFRWQKFLDSLDTPGGIILLLVGLFVMLTVLDAAGVKGLGEYRKDVFIAFVSFAKGMSTAKGGA